MEEQLCLPGEGEDNVNSSYSAECNGVNCTNTLKSSNIVHGSGDVVVLYPSLDIDVSAYEVGRHFVESGVTVQDMNVEAAIKMVKAGASVDEIERAGLSELMPVRKYVRGRAPGLNAKELITRMNSKAKILEEGGKIVSKMTMVYDKVTDKQKAELMGKVLEISVREIMKNHMFIFDGQAYLQTKGGAIGSILTGIVTRVVRDR